MRSISRRVWHVQTRPGSARRDGLALAAGHHVLDRATEQLDPGRVELVRPAADPLGPVEALVEPVRDRLARQQDDVGGPVDQVEVLLGVDRRPR